MPGKKQEKIVQGSSPKREKKGVNILPKSFKAAETAGKIKVVKDKSGATYVKMDIDQYHKIAKTVIKAQQEAMIKKDLTSAFAHVKQMRAGKSEKLTLSNLLSEL